MRWAAILLFSWQALHCAAQPSTNRVVVVGEPADAPTWEDFCSRACAGHAPPGTQLVDCHSVTLATEIAEKLNTSPNGAACEFR